MWPTHRFLLMMLQLKIWKSHEEGGKFLKCEFLFSKDICLHEVLAPFRHCSWIFVLLGMLSNQCGKSQCFNQQCISSVHHAITPINEISMIELKSTQEIFLLNKVFVYSRSRVNKWSHSCGQVKDLCTMEESRPSCKRAADVCFWVFVPRCFYDSRGWKEHFQECVDSDTVSAFK